MLGFRIYLLFLLPFCFWWWRLVCLKRKFDNTCIYLLFEGSLNILQGAHTCLRCSGLEKGRGVESVFLLLEDFGAKKCVVIQKFDNFFGGGDTVCNLIIIVNKKFHKMQDIQSMDCLNGSVKWKQNSFHKQKTQNVLHHMNEINHILFVFIFYNRKKVVFWS